MVGGEGAGGEVEGLPRGEELACLGVEFAGAGVGVDEEGEARVVVAGIEGAGGDDGGLSGGVEDGDLFVKPEVAGKGAGGAEEAEEGPLAPVEEVGFVEVDLLFPLLPIPVPEGDPRVFSGGEVADFFELEMG